MAVYPQNALNPLRLAVAGVRLGLCSTILLPFVVMAEQLPYESGTQGDVFDSGATYNSGRTQLDWVLKDQLTPEQQTLCKLSCPGAYVDPAWDGEEAHIRPDAAPMRATADVSRWLQQSEAELAGNVHVTQGYRRLTADSAVFNRVDNSAKIEGHVVLRQPGVVMFADRLLIDEKQGRAAMENTLFVMHEAHLRGQAGSLEQQRGERPGQDSYILTDGSFTMCAPGDETWRVRGAEITIDAETGQGTARHMRLELGEVPVFYAPYFRFPASDQRMSGLLFPTIALDNRNGFEYAQPIYLNLAPNYDLTVTPRWMEHRGTSVGAEARHLSSLFATTLAGAYLSNDQGGLNDKLQDRADAGEIPQSDVTPYKDEDRWLGQVKQQGGLGQAWYTSVDYTEVSDVDYLRDFDAGSVETSARTHLLQTVGAGYRLEHWQLQVKAEAYQSISTTTVEPYRQMPRVDIDGQYVFDENWNLSLKHQYTTFDHSDEYWDATAANPVDARIVGDRLRTDYRLDLNQQWLWGYIKPAVMVKHLQYDLVAERLASGANATPSLTGAQASLDAGLFFEREGVMLAHDYIQTFEPRLFYFKSPELDHSDLYAITDRNRNVQFDTSQITFSYDQLFRDSRFNGGDRIDDADQLSVGLASRFLQGGSGTERLRLSLGQIFYFANRNVTLDGTPDETPRSEIAGQIAAQIGDNWRYSLDLAYSQENYKPTRGSTSLRYVSEAGRVLSVGYRYQRGGFAKDVTSGELYDTSINQSDIGVVYPLAGDWNLVARSFYDQTLNREMDTFVGLEYDSCCYRMRLLGRRWTDSRDIAAVGPSNLEVDRGLFFEFQLKGLGTLGQRLDQMLSEGIIGFRQRPQYEQ